jgi:GWxTD domain-containing protein
MKASRSLVAAALLLIASNVFAADPTLPDLFKRAKEKFAASDYKGSLADFELMDSISAKPGNEAARTKLLPVVTFYRGANLAALGRKEDAKEAFATYIGYVPNAAITSPPYSKATVDIFEQARNEAASRSTSMSGAFATFVLPAGWKLEPDEHWSETAVRYLLTPAQKREFGTLTTNAERATFIDAFWKQYDPTPTTEVNEFRNEFERRIAFADANFATPKLRGSASDRGGIFAFLGPPTFATQSVVDTSDDPLTAIRGGGKYPGTGGRGLEMQGASGQRESWYYRKGRIPVGVPFPEVRFDFVTKEGYGSNVLQKDAEPMQTFGRATDTARRDKKLN